MVVTITISLNKGAMDFAGNPLRSRKLKCLFRGAQCSERRTCWMVRILARTSESIHVQQVLPRTGAPENLKPSNQISSQHFNLCDCMRRSVPDGGKFFRRHSRIPLVGTELT